MRATRRVSVDLSHTIEDGMITYPGLPAPKIGDHLSREESRAHYAPGTEFHIGRIDMCANTGTYLVTPFHRYQDGDDLAAVPLDRLADLNGVTIDATGAIDRAQLAFRDVRGKAVLIRTGWDRHWGTDAYFQGDPWLSTATLDLLIEGGATLLGVDFNNVDDTTDPVRPAHTRLLGAGIPIVEHLRGLDALPKDGFRFSAVPPRIVRGASF